MDDQVDELNQLGPRWFMALTLPKRVMNEMLAAVNAGESEAFEKRQQEHDREEAKRREDPKSQVGPKDELVIRYPWSLLEGDLSQLYDEQELRNAYQKIKTVASADREKTKNRVALIEHIAARGSLRKNQGPVDWAPKLKSLPRVLRQFQLGHRCDRGRADTGGSPPGRHWHRSASPAFERPAWLWQDLLRGASGQLVRHQLPSHLHGNGAVIERLVRLG